MCCQIEMGKFALTNDAEHSEDRDEDALYQEGSCLPQVNERVDQHIIRTHLSSSWITFL